MRQLKLKIQGRATSTGTAVHTKVYRKRKKKEPKVLYDRCCGRGHMCGNGHRLGCIWCPSCRCALRKKGILSSVVARIKAQGYTHVSVWCGSSCDPKQGKVVTVDEAAAMLCECGGRHVV